MLGDRFADVLARAREGDTEAFAELWRDVQPMLLRYLRVTAGSYAEDVASQTWVRAIEGLSSFTGDEPGLRRWMVTIARNLYVDQLRRTARRPEELVMDISAVKALSHPLAAGANEVAEERMFTQRAVALVATLPPDQAEMIMLRVVVGLDVADVAAMMGRTPGAVRVAVHRALHLLKEQMADGRADVTQGLTEALSRRDG